MASERRHGDEVAAATEVAPVRWIHGGPVADRLGLDALTGGGSGIGADASSVPNALSTSDAPRASAARRDRDVLNDTEAEPAVFAPIEESSLRALGRRGLSRRELGRRLAKAGYEEDAIEAELDRLEATGLIDDLALAQRLVGELQERKQLGRSAIAAELARRILSPAAIGYALDLVDDGDELARARELAAKRARSLTGLDRGTSERRSSRCGPRRGHRSASPRPGTGEPRGIPDAEPEGRRGTASVHWTPCPS